MQHRAFVIMPYGVKPPRAFNAEANETGAASINFDRAYEVLIEPALKKAGCEAVRADAEVAAGDIRTDMFFELVTADLVVADVSIENANVFYELGVRHGVCQRGVFIIDGALAKSKPFDIAPDRAFHYDAGLFACGVPETKELAEKRKIQCETLSKKLKQAIDADPETVGSPVYAHLPGLKPVQWDQIQTSRATYFNSLQDDWRECVRGAQDNGRAGDILTLARFAPTRLHERLLLTEAANALIDMCRYSAAERILREILRMDPLHWPTRTRLALVLSRLARHATAEQQLRKVLQQHEEDPHATDLLGQVLRQLWMLSWKTAKTQADTLQERLAKARDARQLAVSAIRSFSGAHQANPMAYYAGFNALMLSYVMEQAGIGCPELDVDVEELQVVVKYVARAVRDRAIQAGSYEEQFQATTTLAGLALIAEKTDHHKALRLIREACAIPRTSSFRLQSFRDRLQLLHDLNVRVEFVREALEVVDETLHGKNARCACERVLVWFDCSLQDRDFSAAEECALRSSIKAALGEWNPSEYDLIISAAETRADIVFLETCLATPAKLRVLMNAPVGDGDAARSNADRHREQLLAMFETNGEDERTREIWFDIQKLGIPPNRPDEELFAKFRSRRLMEWILNTALMEAEPISRSTGVIAARAEVVPSGDLCGLFFQSGRAGEDKPEAATFVRRVQEFNGYTGRVRIISTGPAEPGRVSGDMVANSAKDN